jgi:hypothetical protein
MMDSNKILESGILEQYVLGLVSDEENAEIEAYMVAYPEVNEKVQRLRSCMEHYTGIHDISSPEEGRDCFPNLNCDRLTGKARQRCLSVETKFGKSQKKEKKEELAEMHNYTRLLTALASISILFFAGLSIFFYQKQASEAASLAEIKQEFSKLEKEHQIIVSQMQTTHLTNELLKDEGTKKMNLKGVGEMPEAEVIVYYNSSQKRTILSPVSLPKAPKDHHYQLWAEVGQRIVNMGTINQGAEKNGIIPINFVANSENFSITLRSNADQPSVKGETCLMVSR